MSYSAEISRTNPSCFLFLIDQSGSMQDFLDQNTGPSLDRPSDTGDRPAGQAPSGRTKAQGVADAINRLLQNLVIKCAKSEGVRDYFYVGVLGYGDNDVRPALGGALSGLELVAISDIANSPLRVEERSKKSDDGAGGIIEQTVKFPVWFDPIAKGG